MIYLILAGIGIAAAIWLFLYVVVFIVWKDKQ